MKYRELLERYKEGLVSEEEKQRIEQDIEKYEAIEEYLSEGLDMDLINLTVPGNSEKHDDETIKIKKSVNSRLRKVIFTSVSIVMGLLIGIFFVISPLVDSYYYNPSKVTVGDNKSDVNFDIYALTELNMPGYSLTSDVHVERHGFGEYDISFYRRNHFTQEASHAAAKIKRSKRTKNQTEINEHISFDYFMDIRHPIGNPNQINEHKQRVMDHIMKLNPVSYVSASLTFEKDLTMEELRKLQVKYPNIEFVWAGIRTAAPDKINQHLIGINLIKNSNMFWDQKNIEEKYPAFRILDWLVNPRGYKSGEMSLDAQAYELHYKSLLQYLIDRKKATDILDIMPRRSADYKAALDYAEENGVKTFGVLTYADAKDLIELVENESLKLVELHQVLASRRYIK
jgi:hypothetical protein